MLPSLAHRGSHHNEHARRLPNVRAARVLPWLTHCGFIMMSKSVGSQMFGRGVIMTVTSAVSHSQVPQKPGRSDATGRVRSFVEHGLT